MSSRSSFLWYQAGRTSKPKASINGLPDIYDSLECSKQVFETWSSSYLCITFYFIWHSFSALSSQCCLGRSSGTDESVQHQVCLFHTCRCPFATSMCLVKLELLLSWCLRPKYLWSKNHHLSHQLKLASLNHRQSRISICKDFVPIENLLRMAEWTIYLLALVLRHYWLH